MRNRLFLENRAKDCTEIEKLRRICCEETDRARHARIDELSVHQKRDLTIVSQLLTHMQELAREFSDSETASSSAATHVPRQPSAIPSSRTMPRRDS